MHAQQAQPAPAPPRQRRRRVYTHSAHATASQNTHTIAYTYAACRIFIPTANNPEVAARLGPADITSCFRLNMGSEPTWAMLGGWVNPHREQQTIPQGQTSTPNISSRQRPTRAPIRRRLRRRQRRGEPHTEHGLGVLLIADSVFLGRCVARPYSRIQSRSPLKTGHIHVFVFTKQSHTEYRFGLFFLAPRIFRGGSGTPLPAFIDI